MTRQAVRLASYRFRATWHLRWGGYLTLALLVGVVGGLAMGAVAAARRTQSSYPTYMASTNPSDLGVITAVLNPAFGSGVGYNPAVVGAIARLPHVRRVVSGVGLDMGFLKPNGAPVSNSYLPISAGNALGSVNGEGFSVDRLAITQGRLADPNRPDEFDMMPAAAKAFGLHVGEVVPVAIYTNAQTQLPGFGTPAVRPYRRIDMKLVGLGVPSTSLVQDQVDQSSELGLFTPALTKQLLACCVNYTGSGVQVQDPGTNLAGVEASITSLLPKGVPPTFITPVSDTLAKADRAIKPESIALGVFGAIAGLAALVIAAQVIGRQLRLGSSESATLRAIGADRVMTGADGLLGLLGAVLVGSFLAVAVAVALSPLAPLGPVRPVYPDPGVSFDWTVLTVGFAVLLVGLGAMAVVLSALSAPHRPEARQGFGRPSRLARGIAALGMSAPAVTGVRFALEPGTGRRAVPVRSAIVGAALAMIVVIATVTFGASLSALVSTPRLYGWNWNYLLDGGGGSGDIPQHQVTQLLDHDRYVAAWSAEYFDTVSIDGQSVPVIGSSPDSSVQPPTLSGHDLGGNDQIVMGPITLADLHKRVGDTVLVGDVVGDQVRLRIVGTATMPTIGEGGEEHLEMGTGAVLSSQLIPAAARNPFNDPEAGPEGIFVRVRSGAPVGAALRSLQAMTRPLSNNANFGVTVVPVLLPAEIVDYHATSITPAILGATLGLAATIALGLTLYSSVRRRRRDLALLKALGFTGRQLATTVAWQSNVAVLIGMVTGIPLGIVAGRSLWVAFARQIDAVPAPTVPAVTVVLIVVGALALANIVAALPGRMAARAPTALLLRSE